MKRAWDFFQGGRPGMALEPVESIVRMPCQRVWFVATWVGQMPGLPASIQRAKQPLHTAFTPIHEQSYYRVGVTLYKRKADLSAGIPDSQTARSERLR